MDERCCEGVPELHVVVLCYEKICEIRIEIWIKKL